MAEFTTPQPLQALLIDASQAPWLNEKDEAAASWDDASLPDRQSVAAWVRTWSEGDEIAWVQEGVVGVGARRPCRSMAPRRGSRAARVRGSEQRDGGDVGQQRHKRAEAVHIRTKGLQAKLASQKVRRAPWP